MRLKKQDMQFSPIETAKRIYFSKNPQYVVFFVTARCNAACKMCFYWQENQEALSHKELSFDEIKAISANMPPFYSLAISGGEPFLRSDLDDICLVFAKNNQIKHLSIPTNGLLTSSIIQQTKKICENAPNTRIEIEFSIDGLAGIHDEIRGVKNNFAIALENIKSIIELEKVYPNLKTKINTTFSKYNQEHLYELIDFLKDNLQLNRTNISMLHGDPRQQDSLDYDIDLYKKTVEYLISKQIVRKSLLGLDAIFLGIKHRSRSLLIKAATAKKYPIKCRALKKYIVIRETGLVYPCEPINNPIGDLRLYNYSLPLLLQSKQAKKYALGFNPQKCRCTWGCAMLNNILYSPFEMSKSFLMSLKYKFRAKK